MAEAEVDFGGRVTEIRPGIREALGPGLSNGGGGGTLPPMDSLIDAKIAAAEARTDAKFANVLSKLELIGSDVRTMRDDNRATRTTVWQAAFTVMGLLVALVALAGTLGPAAFSMGQAVRDIARSEIARSSSPAVARAATSAPTRPEADKARAPS